MRIMYHYLFEEIYKEGEYKNLEPNHKMKRSLQLVNRLYGEETVNFYDDYLDHCEEWCFASLRSVDFKNNPEAAREKINSWVASETDNQLKEFLDQGDVSKDTSLALISAVYFKKKWVKAFTKKGNGAAMFKTDTLPLGTIPHRQHQLPTEARILEIPYENNHLSMLIILPETIDGLPKLVKRITYEKIIKCTQPDNMIPTEVNVEMPSFKLQEKYDLEKALTALGITDLFSDKCDLSGMAPGPLKLSKVVHKCVVEVDEKGTDAEGGAGGVVQTDGKKITESFIVKSPFLFFIRHNSTKSILFWGRVTPPPPVI
ncbi:leukocyte elastase inhibitor-like [Onychostoma macrolepis]|uniref:leukocyte elastase inhibitor-like n=1 Tax=Onychostoma macrolepis TaxID=369639 RepID=UPI00272C3307|nr:leukocyte elastase inhibitor-like [Onychostoma macrolepis]